MKILEQILNEFGADTLKSFTVVPSFGGYFRSVRSVSECSPEKIVLLLKRETLTLEGASLEVAEYFEGDIFIKGDIKVINVEK